MSLAVTMPGGQTVTIPDIAGVTDQSWFPNVAAIFTRAGVPPDIWLPIMMGESGGNPKQPGDNNASWGLFQLFTGGGQGDGYSIAQLTDPVTNAKIAVSAIARAYQEFGDNLTQVAAYSGHPNTSTQGYAEIANNFIPWLIKLFPQIPVSKQAPPTQTQPTQTTDPTPTDPGGVPSGPGTSGATISFSNGILHIVIAILLVIVAVAAMYLGVMIMLREETGKAARSVASMVGEGA